MAPLGKKALPGRRHAGGRAAPAADGTTIRIAARGQWGSHLPHPAHQALSLT